MPTLNNGFGTGCYFSSNVTQTSVTGSVLDFKLKKSASKKEITDSTDNFLQIAFTKRMKVATLDVLIQGSGSNIPIPNIGDTSTMASPWTNEVSGSWGVTDAELKYKSDDFVQMTLELTQWVKADGTTLP